MSPEEVRQTLDAAMATFLVHVEARVASLLGYGFYTIGPCGEELMAALALALEPEDTLSLHYRHLATQILRHHRGGKELEAVLRDRARGYTCSTADPVTGGVHCALGGGANDFMVTSTLASQAPAAVGRALGGQLLRGASAEGVSVVSVGDGSVNNGHFLSALNLAEYAEHRGFKCPVLFVVSDNDICISLRGYGWLERFAAQRVGMRVDAADGNDLAGLAAASREAVERVRRTKRPGMLVVKNLARRFGHAATDRQFAYLSGEEIAAAAGANPLEGAVAQALREGVYASAADVLARFDEIDWLTQQAFNDAAVEDRIQTRAEAARGVHPPRAAPSPASVATASATLAPEKPDGVKVDVMRKHMTRVIDETLAENADAVYLGEDVRHGGYYLVTDGLARKYPERVQDFPPDETSLIGAGIGYAQVGLLPIVEIPYAKYLDCGADQFFEAAINAWLSNGREKNGMVIRLQGFDKGIFGGNFHTHNSLQIPPGVDVVCYSNGRDYVRGWRHAVRMARQGRVVMSVDSTALLNQRHLADRDHQWQTAYPAAEEAAGDDGEFTYDTVSTYNFQPGQQGMKVVITYGNGVPTALRAAAQLKSEHGVAVAVIDTPYLSGVPGGLESLLSDHAGQISKVVFADVCKLGQNPYAGMICELQTKGLLGCDWSCVAAANTYNPLGSTVTFLNEQDIAEAILA